MQKKVFTVYQTNSYIKSLLEEDVILADIFVQGEVSNFKSHSSGHMYFTLKDDYASINCVMFKFQAASLNFKLENGMQVILYGKISLYEKTGNYQIYTELIEPAGKGALHISFEQLKKELAEKGFFDINHKKTLPQNPTSIVLITSPTGAVVQDMIRISKRRNASVSLVVIPTLVQGLDAPKSIVNSIEMANTWGKADVIIVARGGGSAEELWAFNNEDVAKAIYYSHIPIISAVGHETDFTIADFVADIRAATPSEAIEISVPNKANMLENLDNNTKKLNILMENKLDVMRKSFAQVVSRRIFTHPYGNIYNKHTYLSTLQKELNKEIQNILIKKTSTLKLFSYTLNSMSPLNVLQKGYGIIYKDGNIVKSINDIENIDTIKIKLKDGEVLLNIQKQQKGET